MGGSTRNSPEHDHRRSEAQTIQEPSPEAFVGAHGTSSSLVVSARMRRDDRLSAVSNREQPGMAVSVNRLILRIETAGGGFGREPAGAKPFD
jgi:hypothetical protein